MVSHKSAPQSTDSQPPLASQNEDIEFNASLQGNALDLGPEYVHAGSCRAEALWTSEPAFPNGGRFLQNSIWVKKSTWRVEKVSALNVSRAVTPLSKLPVLPRCAVVAHLVGSGSQTATIPRKISAVETLVLAPQVVHASRSRRCISPEDASPTRAGGTLPAKKGFCPPTASALKSTSRLRIRLAGSRSRRRSPWAGCLTWSSETSTRTGTPPTW